MLELTPAAPLASHMTIMTLNPIRSSLATNIVVKGLAGMVTANVQVGTLVWTWENDEGVSTTFRIPNSY
jgi:anthranilate phosphoribosyltransferase